MMADPGCAVPGGPTESEARHCSRFCVGGVSVQLQSQSMADVALLPSLEPFRVEVGVSDINIRVERVNRLVVPSGQPRFASGTTWEVHESEGELQFDFNAAMFGDVSFKRLLIDSRFRQATLQMNEECLGDYPNEVGPMGYPLDELLIMHRLTQEKAIELHSCGIVRTDGTGNLFVGHSGAGKSTTTRLWTALEDVHVLSDDRIIVRRDEGGSEGETPCEGTGGAGEQQVLRLRDRSASPTGRSAQDDRTGKITQDDRAQKQIPPSSLRSRGRNDKGGMRMYGTPWHGEAMYASPGSAPLTRIFILEHGRGNVLTRLSASQAVGELFARSFVPFHRHEYVDSALEFLQELVSAVPVYHYAFEPTEAAVERILEFCD